VDLDRAQENLTHGNSGGRNAKALMTRRRLPILGLLLSMIALLGVGRADAHGSQPRATEPPPVASLEPAATAKLWRHLVATKARRAHAEAGCRPLRAVFYAATDYLRLATKLAENASPCAQYYVFIPSIVGNRTQPRPNAAPRIRALGSNFHAMAEIQFTAWSRWVTSTGSSWYVAGTTARENMAAAGYDVSKGDTWAMNEASTAVRRNTGNARANLREFLRGLYTGAGTQPTRGDVLIVGVGQQTSDVSLYQTNLQSWLADSAFWTDVSAYVSDWSQETYGDVRLWAVPNAPREVRRDYLNDYLQHELVLANAGPSTIDTARTFLQTAYSPLANAAWERESGYGWTMVSSDQMASYVSAQVDALRAYSATTGQAQDHWGFAWAPRNASGASASDFAAQTGQILDRLGAAIRDSADAVDPEDLGSAACGPSGQNVWCVGDLEGAHFNEAWKSFRTWTQPVLAFASAPQTIPAGTPSAPISLALESSSGHPTTTPTPLTVTVTSSSPQGTFSTSPSGPWSPTLSLTIAAGSGTSGSFYYLDTRAGSQVLTASAAGFTNATQTETITPGPAISLTVTPASSSVRARETRKLVASGRDSFGNLFPVSATWSLSPGKLGTIAPRTGSTTTFTALRTLGDGTITAALGSNAATLSASAALHVTAGRLRIGSITYRGKGVALVTVRTLDVAGRPISHASVSALVRRNGKPQVTARATTGAGGRAVFRVPVRKGGCFTTRITKVSAAGFAWDGRTPPNRYCRPRST
jgi:hypothetical protein